MWPSSSPSHSEPSIVYADTARREGLPAGAAPDVHVHDPKGPSPACSSANASSSESCPVAFTTPSSRPSALGHKNTRPGWATSIQTFGSFGANFHPHVHASSRTGLPAADTPRTRGRLWCRASLVARRSSAVLRCAALLEGVAPAARSQVAKDLVDDRRVDDRSISGTPLRPSRARGQAGGNVYAQRRSRCAGWPIAIRNITLLPAACGEKNSVTSSSKKVRPVAPIPSANAARYVLPPRIAASSCAAR